MKPLAIGDRGADVRALQSAINKRARARSLSTVAVDGVFGRETRDAADTVAYALGALKSTVRKRPLTVGLQRIIRQPWTRNPVQLARAVARKRRVHEPEHATRISPNRSGRGGVKPRVIVLHSTEGGYEGSIAWLRNPAAKASAHVINSRDGESTRLVPDAEKAWHAAADNPFTLGLEQEGFASQQTWPDAQLDSTAKWLAYWSSRYDIPLAHSTEHGVCLHSDLGAAGGGHHDPGPRYPLGPVLARAREYRETGW